MTTSTTTITGDAMEKQPSRIDALRYEELGLRLTETITLMFAPTSYGNLPAPGDTVVWPADDTGTTYTVRDVRPLRPDGVTIIAYLACSR